MLDGSMLQKKELILLLNAVTITIGHTIGDNLIGSVLGW